MGNTQAMSSVLFNAEWKDLLMINYPVDLQILEPDCPEGTEIDTWEGSVILVSGGLLF